MSDGGSQCREEAEAEAVTGALLVDARKGLQRMAAEVPLLQRQTMTLENRMLLKVPVQASGNNITGNLVIQFPAVFPPML
jgi:hypothetical protein